MKNSSTLPVPTDDSSSSADNMSLMAQVGSTVDLGKPTTTLPSESKSLEEILAGIQASLVPKWREQAMDPTPVTMKLTPRYSVTQSTEDTPPQTSEHTGVNQHNSGSVLMNDPSGQQQLSVMLSQCFKALKLYGKTSEDLQGTVAMHRMVLEKYPMSLIRKGFSEYLKRNTEMPTPADIVNIIDPPEPTPDWAAYVGIKSKIKEGVYTTKKQRDYLTWCEERAIAKPLEWRETINELEKRMTYENQN